MNDTMPFVHFDLLADRIRDEIARTGAGIWTIGQHLTEAKAQISHGDFIPWLKREFGWSISTAERFMQVHRLFPNSSYVTNLEPGAIYALAAPSTPEPVRAAVLARFDAGERLPVTEVRKIIKAARPPRQQPADASPANVGALDAAIAAVEQLGADDLPAFLDWVDSMAVCWRGLPPRHVAVEPVASEPAPTAMPPEPILRCDETPEPASVLAMDARLEKVENHFAARLAKGEPRRLHRNAIKPPLVVSP
jgi:hypothetical protein